MKLSLKLNLILFFHLVVFRDSWAQLIFPASEDMRKNYVFITTGLEPVWVTTLGYTHMVGTEINQLKLHIGSRLTVAPLIALSNAWRVNLITAGDWKWSHNWRTTLVSEIFLAQQQSRTGLMHGIGMEFRALPSYYGKKGSKGLDIGWQYTLLAHIKHSSKTHNTFEDRYLENEIGKKGPRDGWYRSTVNRFRIGYVSSRKFNSRILFTIVGGILISVQNQGILMGFSHAQFPFYFQSGLIYRW
jgi:hypothetical protein